MSAGTPAGSARRVQDPYLERFGPEASTIGPPEGHSNA
jgi:hypothetical protein